MKTVLLKFSGPLQSWGTDSHFETRHTDDHPSKSGVIGMIAAGLGYRREKCNLERLNTLHYAVRIDQPGQMLRDYHTAKKYKNNGDLERTYVTNRYYLQDAVFVVALSSDNEKLILDVKQAVTTPYFQLFLGRRSLPPAADLFLGITETDPLNALRKCSWQAAEWYQKRNSQKGNACRLSIFADAELIDSDNYRIRNDEAVSFSQQEGRKFLPRREAKMIITLHADSEKGEHDAYGAIGED